MLLQIALLSIFHTLSALFLVAVLYRMYSYIRRFRFTENKYTLLFGFVHLHWIVWTYLFAVLLLPIVSYFILF